jgi:hypothetical protein
MKIRAISTCGIARLLLSHVHSNNKVKVYVPVRAKLFRLFILFSAECAETERPLTRQQENPQATFFLHTIGSDDILVRIRDNFVH